MGDAKLVRDREFHSKEDAESWAKMPYVEPEKTKRLMAGAYEVNNCDFVVSGYVLHEIRWNNLFGLARIFD